MFKQLEINIREKLKHINEETLDELMERESYLNSSEEERSEDSESASEYSERSGLSPVVRKRVKSIMNPIYDQGLARRKGISATNVKYTDKLDEAIQAAKTMVLNDLIKGK